MFRKLNVNSAYNLLMSVFIFNIIVKVCITGDGAYMQNEKTEKKNILTLIKGMIIGATMLVPGVSGGSMAMILGIYDSLICSVSRFFENKKGNFIFLILFAAGGILGMFLFSRPILFLIENYTFPTRFFFMGAVAGSIPFVVSKSRIEKFSLKSALYIAVGIAAVASVSFLPESSYAAEAGVSVKGILLLTAAGFIAAAALVLPGISVSYLLLILGIYDETVMAISQMYIPFIIPLAAGLLLGIVLTTNFLEKAMRTHPEPTYLIILGFVLGSVFELFPGIPSAAELLVSILTFAAGFTVIYKMK